MSEFFKHTQQCDGCGIELDFPHAWAVSDPPDKGWVAIRKAQEETKHFCPKSDCKTKAIEYLYATPR